MNKQLLLLLLIGALVNPIMAHADEDEIATAETQITEETTKTDYVDRVKEKYDLTDEQMKAMEDSKISKAQYAVVGAFAKESGKSVEEILKMRSEGGWGKVAKELGLEPKLIGQSIAAMHRQNDTEKQVERKEARELKKAERKQKREEKKLARKENRSNKKDRNM